jgi:hypothetical protein
MLRSKLLVAVGLLGLGIALLSVSAGASAAKPATKEVVTVYKSSTCECCKKWVEHLQAAGFTVNVHDEADMAKIKDDAGVPAAARSCHTARVGKYLVEGHVPADLIVKMLEERPHFAGIAAPGMPVGSPGMERGDQKPPYDIVSFTKDGKTEVYAKR